MAFKTDCAIRIQDNDQLQRVLSEMPEIRLTLPKRGDRGFGELEISLRLVAQSPFQLQLPLEAGEFSGD
jgi:hypothetical protein